MLRNPKTGERETQRERDKRYSTNKKLKTNAVLIKIGNMIAQLAGGKRAITYDGPNTYGPKTMKSKLFDWMARVVLEIDISKNKAISLK